MNEGVQHPSFQRHEIYTKEEMVPKLNYFSLLRSRIM